MPFPQPSEQRAAWVYSDRPGGQCAKTLLCRRGFFHEWPAHRQAADLVVARNGEIDGNLYYLLDPVARWLEGAHPLAATLLRRAMIEDTLEGLRAPNRSDIGMPPVIWRSVRPWRPSSATTAGSSRTRPSFRVSAQSTAGNRASGR